MEVKYVQTYKTCAKNIYKFGKRVQNQGFYPIILNFNFLSTSLLNDNLLQFINHISSAAFLEKQFWKIYLSKSSHNSLTTND